MSPALAVAVAAIFLWLGMVVAISFIEAPLRFRAPGVTLQIGLGIGRLVFRALNGCELVLAVVLVAAFVVDALTVGTLVAAGVAVLTLLAQVLLVRPKLTTRSDAVLTGADRAVIDAIAVAAEKAGFATLWSGEHAVMVDESASRYPYSDDGRIAAPAEADWIDPLIGLSFVAAAIHTLWRDDVASF